MNNTISYLNTDLMLTSTEDLSALVASFKAGGAFLLFPLDQSRHDERWFATFETEDTYAEPEPNIAAMLLVVETLAEPLRGVWERCTQREFNVGYDCGAEPWAFNHGLSASLLSRMGATGSSLRITLYPDREDMSAKAFESEVA